MPDTTTSRITPNTRADVLDELITIKQAVAGLIAQERALQQSKAFRAMREGKSVGAPGSMDLATFLAFNTEAQVRHHVEIAHARMNLRKLLADLDAAWATDEAQNAALAAVESGYNNPVIIHTAGNLTEAQVRA